MGKEEIARNKQFLLFPTVFSTRFKSFLPLLLSLKLSSADSFSLEQSKICRLGKGYRLADTATVSDKTDCLEGLLNMKCIFYLSCTVHTCSFKELQKSSDSEYCIQSSLQNGDLIIETLNRFNIW